MKSKALTIAKIKALTPDSKAYTVCDGDGLCLEVKPNRVKTWYVRFHLNKTPMKQVIGRFGEMNLDDAREMRDKIKTAARQGKTLAEEQQEQTARAERQVSVKEFGQRYIREIVSKARKESRSIQRYLDRDVYPKIGAMAMKSVTLYELRAIIFAHRDAGHPQAALTLRDLLKRIWDYAVICGIIAANPLQALKRKFIASAKSRERNLSADEIGALMVKLEGDELARRLSIALQFVLITLLRKSEVRLARWEHFNLRRREWKIPAEHTKNGKQHVVYLSERACRLLGELMAAYPHSKPPKKHYVIHSFGSYTQPIAPSTLNQALGRIASELPHFTVHDLRRSAATLLSEEEYSADVIEKALNHNLKGIRGVYNRAQYREQRRAMLAAWSDKVEDLAIEARKQIDGSGAS